MVKRKDSLGPGKRWNPGGKLEYSIGVVARIIRRSRDFILAYHEKGFIPPAWYFGPSSRPWRWYTENQVRLLHGLVRGATSRQRFNKADFAYLRKHWEDDYGEYEAPSEADDY
jgi:hypothetical protein